ncbi:MAG: hypothetical protein QM775_25325 [Pirellulales bacterium]
MITDGATGGNDHAHAHCPHYLKVSPEQAKKMMEQLKKLGGSTDAAEASADRQEGKDRRLRLRCFHGRTRLADHYVLDGKGLSRITRTSSANSKHFSRASSPRWARGSCRT